MAGIPTKKQPAPQRTTQRYTEGTGFAARPTATTSTSPLLGPTGDTPLYPYIFGVDFDESNQLAVPSLAAGASTTLTNTVSFPDIPSLKLDPSDNASLQIIPHVWQNPIKPGLVIASVAWQPQVLLSSTKTWIPADQLIGGQVYTAWRVQFTIGVTAVAATTAANLNVGAAAILIVFSI